MAQASSKQPGRKAGPAPGDRHEAEPQGGLRLLVDGLPGLSGLPCLAEPLDPQSLAALHPLWARDAQALGPWRLEPGQGKSDPVWLPGTLPGGSEGADVVVCGPCTSTMDVARELAGRSGLRPWASVITPIQTGGRGQLRRAWLSAPGNVLATLVCPPAEGLWNDLRPLVLGHLLAEALMDEYPGVEVKWPNDLLLDGRKIGGILVEERPGLVLAGLGLNLAWAPDAASLREGAYVPAGVFPARAGGPGPLGLWLKLVKRLETGYRALLETFSPSDFLLVFQSRLAWLGRRVLVTEGPGLGYEAFIRGVSGKGELVLDRDGREILLLAGDVTPL